MLIAPFALASPVAYYNHTLFPSAHSFAITLLQLKKNEQTYSMPAATTPAAKVDGNNDGKVSRSEAKAGRCKLNLPA